MNLNLKNLKDDLKGLKEKLLRPWATEDKKDKPPLKDGLKEDGKALWGNRIFKIILISAFVFLLAKAIAPVSASGLAISDNATDAAYIDPSAFSTLQNCVSNYTRIIEKSSSCEGSLQTCQSTSETLTREVSNWSSEYTSCSGDLYACEDALTEKSDLLEECEDERAGFDVTYDTLAVNYANRYCCAVNMLLGTNYQYYGIVNNDVVCLKTGTNALNCTVS